jgi:hypothetical protein
MAQSGTDTLSRFSSPITFYLLLGFKCAAWFPLDIKREQKGKPGRWHLQRQKEA